MTLEEYLRANFDRLVIDHAFRVMVDAGGRIWFYVHPANTDGNTLTFRVEGNTLEPLSWSEKT